MAEHTFFCGIDPPARRPKDCHVLCTHGPGRNIELDPLRINKRLLKNIPPRLLDLIDIATYVFAADRTTRRGGKTGQGMGKDWRRNLRFRIAVRDPAHWSQPELMLALNDVLGFMSEDSFQFEFVKLAQAPDDQAYFDFGNSPPQDGPSAPVVLFSGGLDSLAGALEELSSDGKQVALVTHLSSDMMTSYQVGLADELRKTFQYRVLHLPVRMNLTNGLKSGEGSQRTRTFLFSAIAGAVAAIIDAPGIRFYENGIMSLNLPISAQVVGTAATRSTHPRTLAEMSLFLEAAVGRPCAVDNPFAFKTKAEVLKVIEQRGQARLIEMTMSCTEVRKRVKECTHCGGCIQCLHRRFGVRAAGLDAHDPAGKYVLDLFEAPRAGNDRTMAVDLVRVAQSYVSMSDTDFLQKYALEFSRILGTTRAGTEEKVVRDLIDLHRRHGEQITGVIKAGLVQYKDALSKGQMAPGSLLTFVVAEQRGTRCTADQPAPPLPTQTASASTISLMIDDRRNTYTVNALPEIQSKAGVPLLVLLAEQHRKDRNAERKLSEFDYLHSHVLTAALEIDEDTLRRRVERIRDKITKLLADAGTAITDRELVVQSKVWGGYRLNPEVHLIAPD